MKGRFMLNIGPKVRYFFENTVWPKLYTRVPYGAESSTIFYRIVVRIVYNPFWCLFLPCFYVYDRYTDEYCLRCGDGLECE